MPDGTGTQHDAGQAVLRKRERGGGCGLWGRRQFAKVTFCTGVEAHGKAWRSGQLLHDFALQTAPKKRRDVIRRRYADSLGIVHSPASCADARVLANRPPMAP